MSRDEEVADLYGRLERLEAERARFDELLKEVRNAWDAEAKILLGQLARFRTAIAPSEENVMWARRWLGDVGLLADSRTCSDFLTAISERAGRT